MEVNTIETIKTLTVPPLPYRFQRFLYPFTRLCGPIRDTNPLLLVIGEGGQRVIRQGTNETLTSP